MKTYKERVQEMENKGMSTSDAQGVVDAEDLQEDGLEGSGNPSHSVSVGIFERHVNYITFDVVDGESMPTESEAIATARAMREDGEEGFVEYHSTMPAENDTVNIQEY